VLSQPQGHGVAGKILSMKNSNDAFGNRARDLPACSTNCATGAAEELSLRECFVNIHRPFEDHITLILRYEKSEKTEEAGILIGPNGGIY